MNTFALVVGWTLIALPLVIGAYAFVGYPLLVGLWARVRPPFTLPDEPAEWPRVTVLIVAYNEAARIRPTLDALLEVDYPKDRLDVLVVSDASTDDTDAIVTSFANRGVRLLRMSERRGKPAGENASAAVITSDIVVSVDAAILIPKTSLKPLVRAMLHPEVGCASGHDQSIGDASREGNQAEASYVDLEMRLRGQETRVHSIVGASGCFYAARRELHQVQLPEHLSRDFAAASVARRRGFRAVSVEQAVCLVPRTRSLQAELRRKSRTMGRGLATLWYLREMLNPFRYGSYAFMMSSHKLARWLLFPALLGWLIGPLFLGPSMPLFYLLSLAMAGGIVLGLVVAQWPTTRKLPTVLAFPGYAFVSVLAGWLAWWNALRGNRKAVWEPTQRPDSLTTGSLPVG